jgi:LmbE family N-acetylglucosaminyl deacetylase
MATLVFFHAHPDDESIATGGSMRRAADEGHRVVLVLATMGEHGEVAEGFLDPAETLGERRLVETQRSAEILGVNVVEFLGYVDSGMMDTPENEGDGSFWGADVEEAAQRLATILEREAADVLTIYDENGNYGHPDHIQVHRVGRRAAELAGVARVFESTVNRDEMRRGFAELVAKGDLPGDDAPTAEELEALGVAETLLTHRVDVRTYLQVKRDSMRAHASQIGETSFFLTMPDDAFAEAFGTEWYIRTGQPTPVAEFGTWLLDD